MFGRKVPYDPEGGTISRKEFHEQKTRFCVFCIDGSSLCSARAGETTRVVRSTGAVRSAREPDYRQRKRFWPARWPPELALREFAPSYERATIMQVSLAIGGLALGLTAAWRLHDSWVAVGAVLLGASVPVTLIVLFPANKQLLDPTLDSGSPRVAILFRRWNRLHAIRSLLSATAFGVLLCRAAMR